MKLKEMKKVKILTKLTLSSVSSKMTKIDKTCILIKKEKSRNGHDTL